MQVRAVVVMVVMVVGCPLGEHVHEDLGRNVLEEVNQTCSRRS
jgi:hypothetical protein